MPAPAIRGHALPAGMPVCPPDVEEGGDGEDGYCRVARTTAVSLKSRTRDCQERRISHLQIAKKQLQLLSKKIQIRKKKSKADSSAVLLQSSSFSQSRMRVKGPAVVCFFPPPLSNHGRVFKDARMLHA
jgi:hypothetical protein